ncbi:MAG TPA: SagB/ThcOx family dehydrogenase [Dongiaceae bacterium]|nr:SagB/ThcOx family dehydrogenase [Dongiaceae bacterium]
MAVERIPVQRLPEAVEDGRLSVEGALSRRRSVRDFAGGAVTLGEVGQLLWAAQGVTDSAGLRAAPSAGALYPLELRLVAGEVTGLSSGIYRYDAAAHALRQAAVGDRRTELAAAALGQRWIAEAAAVLVIAAVHARTTGKYGERGRRYVQIEVGHAAQNVCLQAVALGLGATVVGAFDDAEVMRVVGLDGAEEPLALLPIGRAPGSAAPG